MHYKKPVIIFIFIFFYSTFYIQPDDGNVCTAETCSCFTCLIKQFIDCNRTSLLNIRILEEKGMSCIRTVYPKLHKMLDSFHYSVEFRNLSRF
jgi:hypothetical protein